MLKDRLWSVGLKTKEMIMFDPVGDLFLIGGGIAYLGQEIINDKDLPLALLVGGGIHLWGIKSLTQRQRTLLIRYANNPVGLRRIDRVHEQLSRRPIRSWRVLNALSDRYTAYLYRRTRIQVLSNSNILGSTNPQITEA